MKNDELQHYGVMGMKWGVRRNPKNRPPSGNKQKPKTVKRVSDNRMMPSARGSSKARSKNSFNTGPKSRSEPKKSVINGESIAVRALAFYAGYKVTSRTIADHTGSAPFALVGGIMGGKTGQNLVRKYL